MYGEVVDGVDGQRFEGAIADLKARRGVANDLELGADDLRELIATFQHIYEEEVGSGFPQDPREQLRRAYRAVFDSWDAPRAQVYRHTYEIPDDIGTAVNVVQMVFGNKGESSGTGVCFTRDPSTGESVLYGEFLVNAQGEDVVSGMRTPEPISEMQRLLPEAYAQLIATLDRLEAHYRDMQDIEFTVEEGRLYLLQTRTGKRTATAALRVAVEMAGEGLIAREEAVARIDPGQLDQLLHPMIDPSAVFEVAAQGLNASPGAASGEIVLDADTAAERGKAGDDVILVRWETTPDDIHGLIQARGVLTAHGGMTSHAAVVARGMGKPCVAGCEGLSIDAEAGTVTIGEHVVNVGDVITIDGGTGRVIIGPVRLVPPAIDENFGTILDWADRAPPAPRPRECGYARGCRQGARVRSGGHRPLPHRAHVHGPGPAADRAGDDPGAGRASAPHSARQAAPDAAVRLRGHLRGDGRVPGHDPPPRSAAARVPALARGGDLR